MLTLYWFCFAISGVFVALAVMGGLDWIDFDHQIDSDIEVANPGDRVISGASNSLKFALAIARSYKSRDRWWTLWRVPMSQMLFSLAIRS